MKLNEYLGLTFDSIQKGSKGKLSFNIQAHDDFDLCPVG